MLPEISHGRRKSVKSVNHIRPIYVVGEVGTEGSTKLAIAPPLKDEERKREGKGNGNKYDICLIGMALYFWKKSIDIFESFRDKMKYDVNFNGYVTAATGFGNGGFNTGHPVTFEDVAGQDAAKNEIMEVVEFLKCPAKFIALGAKVPNILLLGQAGLGKTLLARAVAGEANVPFLYASGSEFIDMDSDEAGANRIRRLFKCARENKQCIVFIDDIDAIGSGANAIGANARVERSEGKGQDLALNQLLIELDGLKSNDGIVVIAATSRTDLVIALTRSGRFDRRIHLEHPGKDARLSILKLHSRGKPISDSISLLEVANSTTGFSGAELVTLLNESAIIAARKDKKEIGPEEMDAAYDRLIMGLERPSPKTEVTANQRHMVAYHEAGHAICAAVLLKQGGDFDEVRKVSILPRGNMGGVTVFSVREELGRSRQYMENQLIVALGGRVAEEIIAGPGHVTTGASYDLAYVQQVARQMVTCYGFCDEHLSPVSWPTNTSTVSPSVYSEDTNRKIDEMIRNLAHVAHRRAKGILEGRPRGLKAVAHVLVLNETMSGDDVMRILNNTVEMGKVV